MSATPDLDALTARAEQLIEGLLERKTCQEDPAGCDASSGPCCNVHGDADIFTPDMRAAAALLRDLLTYATTAARRRDEITQGLADIQRHRDAWRRYAYTGESKPSDFLDGNQVDRTQTFIEDLRDQLATVRQERDEALAVAETLAEQAARLLVLVEGYKALVPPAPTETPT